MPQGLWRRCAGAALGVMLVAGAPSVQAKPSEADVLRRMALGEPALTGHEMEEAVRKADKHALGSEENPIRAAMPEGQRAYLSRLRCSDGSAPAYHRRGNVGHGVFANIVDLYDVTCAGAEPASSEIYMDMYHAGYIEKRAVPGFTIVASEEADLPAGTT